MWIISGVYLCKWICVRAFVFWRPRRRNADGTGEKGGYFGNECFLSLKHSVPSDHAKMWHMKFWEKHQPPLRSFASWRFAKTERTQRSLLGGTGRTVSVGRRHGGRPAGWRGQRSAAASAAHSRGRRPRRLPRWGVHSPTLSSCVLPAELIRVLSSHLESHPGWGRLCLSHPRPPNDRISIAVEFTGSWPTLLFLYYPWLL